MSERTSQSRKRVLFVAHSPHRGGAEYCLDTILRHLDRTHFEPIVAFPFDGPMADSARELGIETLILPMCHWLYFKRDLWYWRNLLGRSWGNVRRFKHLIQNRRIDLVYTNTSTIFEPAIAAKRAGVPHLWHVHEVLKPGNDMSQLLPIRWLQRFIRRHSSQVVFESHSARAAFEQCTPVANAQVVFNSVRISKEHISQEQISRTRQGFQLTAGVTTVIFVGQFIDRKNPMLLVNAMAQLPRSVNAQCLLVGSGPLESTLRERIASLGLSDQCRIVPFQSDIAPIYEASDVLVLPSRQESFGLVLIEAAAYRKPVIACRCQGPDEIVVDGETGFLIEQDDEHALAAAITQLIQRPQLATQMGEAGCQRASLLFSPEKNTLRLQTLMHELC